MPANTDMWQIIEMLEGWFDKATGLSELMYGQSNRQYRSAAEAEIKKDQANIRPEDMANRVEDWQSLVARREAFASRWHLQGNDVMPFLGKPGAALWQMLVVNQDPASMLYDLQYRVEAGSIRKPNRSRDAENATALMQNVMPIAIQYFQMTGNIDAVNQILALWKKSMDIDQSLVNFAPLMMPGMGPTLPPGAPAPEPGKGGAKGGAPQPAMAA
jgi:hypothetical protein